MSTGTTIRCQHEKERSPTNYINSFKNKIEWRQNIICCNESKQRRVIEICALLGYYAASCGNCLPTFRDKVSVPSSRAKIPSRKERKPATYKVDYMWEGARGVAISRRDDNQ